MSGARIEYDPGRRLGRVGSVDGDRQSVVEVATPCGHETIREPIRDSRACGVSVAVHDPRLPG
jgi:hypothetical protein